MLETAKGERLSEKVELVELLRRPTESLLAIRQKWDEKRPLSQAEWELLTEFIEIRHVEGFAPTSRAAQQLEEAGIHSGTLQHHLARSRHHDSQRHLYILDESSLGSSRQVNEFLHRLQEQDRVILVGDSRQHQGVEAGRPFQQLQEAGLETAHLDEIIRQKDPALKEVVQDLAAGRVGQAIEKLRQQGRVHAMVDREERLQAIARTYAECPDNTLVVSPDNHSQEINRCIRGELQSRGSVEQQGHRLNVLLQCHEMTGADRQWAGKYDPGDVVRYTRGSRGLGVKAGDYLRVVDVDRGRSLLVVKRPDRSEINYDPIRLQGVSVYAAVQREFSVGDRVQFTAPFKEQRIANRQLATVERIDSAGNLQLRMNSGRQVQFNIRNHPHLDYGYAVTSHSSQGPPTGSCSTSIQQRQTSSCSTRDWPTWRSPEAVTTRRSTLMLLGSWVSHLARHFKEVRSRSRGSCRSHVSNRTSTPCNTASDVN